MFSFPVNCRISLPYFLRGSRWWRGLCLSDCQEVHHHCHLWERDSRWDWTRRLPAPDMLPPNPYVRGHQQLLSCQWHVFWVGRTLTLRGLRDLVCGSSPHPFSNLLWRLPALVPPVSSCLRLPSCSYCGWWYRTRGHKLSGRLSHVSPGPCIVGPATISCSYRPGYRRGRCSPIVPCLNALSLSSRINWTYWLFPGSLLGRSTWRFQ